MTSLTDLRELVDVVIGVDTHVHTHTAAAVDTRTGGVLAQVTVEATADGYACLVQFADQHATLRAWAIEGTGGHGAGLSRHVAGRHDRTMARIAFSCSAASRVSARTRRARNRNASTVVVVSTSRQDCTRMCAAVASMTGSVCPRNRARRGSGAAMTRLNTCS
jgi:hypothetical protein